LENEKVNVVVNGKNVSYPLTATSTLGEIVKKFIGEYKKMNMLLTSVKRGEEVIPLDKISELKDSQLISGETIEMQFVDMREYAINTIDTASEYVDRARQNCYTVNQLFTNGNIKEGLQQFQYLMEGIESINAILSGILKLMGGTLTEKDLSYLNVGGTMKRIEKILPTLESALKKGDYISVGDIVEYEIPDELTLYEEIMQKIKGILTRKVN